MASDLERLMKERQKAAERANVVALATRYIAYLADDIITANNPLIMSLSRDAISDVVDEFNKLKAVYEAAARTPVIDVPKEQPKQENTKASEPVMPRRKRVANNARVLTSVPKTGR